MKRYLTYRYALLPGILLLCVSLASCNPNINNIIYSTETIVIYTEDFTYETPREFENSKNPSTPIPATSTVNPLPSVTPSAPSPIKPPEALNKEVLKVRGTTLMIGESSDALVKKLGSPSRILDTEYDFNYYIYNNDYKKLLFVAIKNNKVIGFYTDSLDFSFQGISSGSSLSTVNRVLGKTFSVNELLTYRTDTYTLFVLIDTLGTQKVTGLYVLSSDVKPSAYTDSVMRNIELLVYDLTNSVRARNGVAILSWSSSAAISSRKHSIDMAMNRFFDHVNPDGNNPGDRMKAEGIFYSSCSENIIAGYGTSIISNHAWFNSSGHRSNMLSNNFRYLGVGFTYQPGSLYQTYITQNFYR